MKRVRKGMTGRSSSILGSWGEGSRALLRNWSNRGKFPASGITAAAPLRSRIRCTQDPATLFPGCPPGAKYSRVDLASEHRRRVGRTPSQDLSQAGRAVGLTGHNSGLVGETFRLLATPGRYPEWQSLENVSFMLHLSRSRGKQAITGVLSAHQSSSFQ